MEKPLTRCHGLKPTPRSGARSGKLSPGLSILDEGEQQEERQQVAEALE